MSEHFLMMDDEDLLEAQAETLKRVISERNALAASLREIIGETWCECDGEHDEYGCMPADAAWAGPGDRPTNFWGEPVWAERCRICRARAVLESLPAHVFNPPPPNPVTE